MNTLISEFFELVREQSPFEIEAYRRRGRERAKSGGLAAATTFSALEQAQWDLVGKALGAPVYELGGGKLRASIPLYANINRATTERTPAAFSSNAARAVAQGFKAVKAAPFDGKSAEEGIPCVEAMRRAIGPDVDLLVDCHSRFDVKLAIHTARRLEPQRLFWYEEPVSPLRLDETVAIRAAIKQRMAGGELLFGVEGFAPLCRRRAVDVIMPDVKHCGGLEEGRHIAALAALDGVLVSPHNPSGPVATAAGVQWCAGMPNFAILEYAWGEVSWRADLLEPPERVEGGELRVPTAPGFAIELNEKAVREHA